jgi:hypothetical protein
MIDDTSLVFGAIFVILFGIGVYTVRSSKKSKTEEVSTVVENVTMVEAVVEEAPAKKPRKAKVPKIEAAVKKPRKPRSKKV